MPRGNKSKGNAKRKNVTKTEGKKKKQQFDELAVSDNSQHPETVLEEDMSERPELSLSSPEREAFEATPTSSARLKSILNKNTRYQNSDYDLQQSGPLTLEDVTRSSGNFISSGSPGPTTSQNGTVPQEQIKQKQKKRVRFDIPEAQTSIAGTSEEAPQPEDTEKSVEKDPDGPPVLTPSDPMEEDFGESNGMEEDDGYGDPDETPPDLEENPPCRVRGRPKRSSDSSNERKERSDRKRQKINHIGAKTPSNVIVKQTVAENKRNLKLFLDELETTPEGDTCAVVLPGCMGELMRKEKIIDLLTSETACREIQKAGWFLDRPPRLPPLVAEKATFAFYINGATCKNAKDISYDDLRPWSTTNEGSFSGLHIKPNVRRHPVARIQGTLQIVKHELMIADYHLTEYSARLPREERLRKKIFYMSRNNAIFGNVLIFYDYASPGNIPVPINLPHGNDLMRIPAMMQVASDSYSDSPFESQAHEGSRGGYYLKLKANKLGWAHNKKHLLDYLYNKPSMFENGLLFNQHLPDLPPLIETVGVFVYFVPSKNVLNQFHHAADGLSPWTTTAGISTEAASTLRVRSTRRAVVFEHNGFLSMARDSKAPSSIWLVETMTTLARCRRVRKRVYYLQQRNSMLIGNICYIYEFVNDGPIPTLQQPMEIRRSKWPIAKKEEGEDEETEMIDVTESYAEEMVTITPEAGDEDFFLDDIDRIRLHRPERELVMKDFPIEDYPDMPEDGVDREFDDSDVEHPDPYYDKVRVLSTGHCYLTVRHKRIVTQFDHVLDWIMNSDKVEQRGLLNDTKPAHPPMIVNTQAYVFFVAGSAIFPHEINRDDLSPWSNNGNINNPTCYRTKVRKIGVISDPQSSTFIIRGKDYKKCPYHLVFLYSICPRDPRLRKKIFYMMETKSRMIVSHAMILYDYNASGQIVKLSSGNYKSAKKYVDDAYAHLEYLEEMTISEQDRPCPFRLPMQKAIDGTLFFNVCDPDFWNDRNRHLEYLFNQPSLCEEFCCLNNKVPDFPPPSTVKGVYVFFINGEEVSYRSLFVDRLCPWSESSSANSYGAVTKRPKSCRIPLGLNQQDQLRLLKTASGLPPAPTDYQLHVYTATLPRCTRLRKKVVYVQQSGRPIGNAMIMYSYTEAGDLPVPHESFGHDWWNDLNVHVQDDIMHLIRFKAPETIVRLIEENHGVHMNINMVYMVKKYWDTDKINYDLWARGEVLNEEENGMEPQSSAHEKLFLVERNGEQVVKDEQDTEGETSQLGHQLIMPLVGKAIMDHEIAFDGEEIVIENTDDPEDDVLSRRNPFLEKTTASTGFVRGSQRFDAMWRIAKKHYGNQSDGDTFNEIFRLLLAKNDERLIQLINNTYNVDLAAHDDQLITDYVNDTPMTSRDDMLQATYLEQPSYSGNDSSHSMVDFGRNDPYSRQHAYQVGMFSNGLSSHNKKNLDETESSLLDSNDNSMN